MKRLVTIFLLLGVILPIYSQNFVCIWNNGAFKVWNYDSLTFVRYPKEDPQDGYADLGLSVNWATCNLGGENPADYGETYSWYNATADSVSWGKPWRVPTKAEVQELIDKCTWKRDFKYGRDHPNDSKKKLEGVTISRNGSSIFLPATGDNYGATTYKQADYMVSPSYLLHFRTGGNLTKSPVAEIQEVRNKEKKYYIRPVFTSRKSKYFKHKLYLWWHKYDAKNNLNAYKTEYEFDSLTFIQLPQEEEYVDLGLSVKWATRNLGATNALENGDYFAWGETYAKGTSQFDLGHYEYYREAGSGWDIYNKYNSHDSLTTLVSTDDAATAILGKQWRMPTKDEARELYSKCKYCDVNLFNLEGRVFISPNGNYILLPNSGYIDIEGKIKEGSVYWTSSLDTDVTDYYYGHYVWGMNGHMARSNGTTIRPVFQGDE